MKDWRGSPFGKPIVAEFEATPPPTYAIRDNPHAMGGKTITCLVCGRTSYHPMDVQERYCGFCHMFHDL